MVNRVISGPETGPITVEASDNLTIQAGGSLTNLESAQPAITQAGFSVSVSGSVVSAGTGVVVSSGIQILSIAAGGEIRAEKNGVEFKGPYSVPYFDNRGLVEGERAGLVFETDMWSSDRRWPYSGPQFKNSGEIRGGEFGIEFLKSGGFTNDGTVAGRIGISAHENLNLVNAGTIAGDEWSIFLTHPGGGSQIVNSGVLIGDVSLGGGTDVFNGSAGRHYASDGGERPAIFGLAGHDQLVGGDSSEYLDGGADGDFLSGGGGYDILFGGEGDDTYVFDGADLVDESGGAVGDHDTVRQYAADLDLETSPLIAARLKMSGFATARSMQLAMTLPT